MDPMPSRAARTASVVLTVFLWITVIAALGLVAHRLFGLLQDSHVLTVPASAAVDDVRLPKAFEIGGPLPVNVDIVQPSLLQRVIATVPGLIWLALAFLVLWLLRGVTRSAAEGEPFRAPNVARLRWVGALFLLAYPLAAIVEGTFTEWLFSADVWRGGPLPPGGIATEFSLVSGPAILAAVSLFALAEIFAYGARLREDVDATI